MSNLPNVPLSWLDKKLGAGYSTVQSSGTSAAQETTIDFTGVPVVDDPINGRTIVKISNEATMPISGVYCPTGSTTLLAEVDLLTDATGSLCMQGSVNGATVGGSITTLELLLSYGTVAPSDTLAAHRKFPSTDDLRYGNISAVVTGLAVGTTYRCGFYAKPVGDSMTTTAGAGALNAREARR